MAEGIHLLDDLARLIAAATAAGEAGQRPRGMRVAGQVRQLAGATMQARLDDLDARVERLQAMRRRRRWWRRGTR
ncbi:hypothetical protein [Nonomuraea sp. 10N515B]|uniref:hypothetical protein n=1 Tax=Nonomuraea sp. 10N515B TaxID=3457422 RepID=UPI003FCDEADB